MGEEGTVLPAELLGLEDQKKLTDFAVRLLARRVASNAIVTHSWEFKDSQLDSEDWILVLQHVGLLGEQTDPGDELVVSARALLVDGVLNDMLAEALVAEAQSGQSDHLGLTDQVVEEASKVAWENPPPPGVPTLPPWSEASPLERQECRSAVRAALKTALRLLKVQWLCQGCLDHFGAEDDDEPPLCIMCRKAYPFGLGITYEDLVAEVAEALRSEKAQDTGRHPVELAEMVVGKLWEGR